MQSHKRKIKHFICKCGALVYTTDRKQEYCGNCMTKVAIQKLKSYERYNFKGTEEDYEDFAF